VVFVAVAVVAVVIVIEGVTKMPILGFSDVMIPVVRVRVADGVC